MPFARAQTLRSNTHRVEEACKLGEVGFEHVCDVEGVELFKQTEVNAVKAKEEIVVRLPSTPAKRDSSGA